MFLKGERLPNIGPAKFRIEPGVVAECYHFKNAAARAEGLRLYGEACENMAIRIVAVKRGDMNPNLFDRKFIKLGAWARRPIERRKP